MKQMIFIFLMSALLLWPSFSDARRTQVYVGIGVGTAVAIGGGIASFNVGVSQRVDREPESPSPATDSPPLLAEISHKEATAVRKPLFELRIDSPLDPPQPLRFELPLFILRW